MKTAGSQSWNERMRNAEKRSIRMLMPLFLWPRWTRYQLSRFWSPYLRRFVSSRSRKSLFRCIGELCLIALRWRCIPFHYFRHALYEQGNDIRVVLDYLPETVFYYRHLPKWRLDACLLDNKVLFYSFAKTYKLPTPVVILTVRGGRVRCDSARIVTDEAELHLLMQQVESDRIFLKPALATSSGHGIIVFHRQDMQFVSKEGVAFGLQLLREVSGGEWILEEGVVQNEVMSLFYGGSTNTLKITTAVTSRGAEAICCVARFGRAGLEVDNLHAGGLLVGVALDTGQIQAPAIDQDLVEYDAHPDSGIKFSEQRVEIMGAINLACRAALLFPAIPIAGWDIALAPAGPVILEGNSSPDIASIQRFGGVREKLLDSLKDRNNY